MLNLVEKVTRGTVQVTRGHEPEQRMRNKCQIAIRCLMFIGCRAPCEDGQAENRLSPINIDLRFGTLPGTSALPQGLMDWGPARIQ